MSLRVGLGASQADLDVQGEIDFDFFEESDSFSNSNKTISKSEENVSASGQKDLQGNALGDSSGKYSSSNETNVKDFDPNTENVPESYSSHNFNKPVITVSCDDNTGVIQKTMIETVIPSPFNYKDNKCGKVSPGEFRKSRKLLSPRLKSKIFKDEKDISDDSSISSMSESESDLTGSEDSFELDEETDSMTDVSPLPSPYTCQSPVPEQNTDARKVPEDSCEGSKKGGVKFTDDRGQKPCVKCESINLQELLKAVKRLEMKQNINSLRQERGSASSVMTQNEGNRKNFSFSNEEVRRIDNENQVLLKKIMAQENRKPHSAPPIRVLSSSAVNRQKQKRQIELENLALLKRLESTKPSRDVSRFHLLRDYDRRSSGFVSRASSRSSKSCSNSSQGSSCRTSNQSSGRSSAISIASSNSSASHPVSFPK